MSRLVSVVVLCPNGRRETLKISANCSILQVLEEACSKQNLNPEDFDIWHSKKMLDLTLPIRFANLPNNALLELQPARNSRKDSLVTIALQLESGERFMKDFTPSSTLSDVIKQSLQSDSLHLEDGEPVCIYMRQKIIGEAIKNVTLRSLGLTQGAAIIRLMYRKPEVLENQAHISSPLTASATSNASQFINKREGSISTLPVSEDEKEVVKSEFKSESSFDKGNQITSSMETDCNENKFSNGGENKNTSIHSIEEKTIVSKSENLPTTNQSEKMECENEAADINQTKSIVQNSIEEPEEIGNINYIGERHAVLYSLEDITVIKKADLPDEFFELTVNDVRYLMEDYKRERAKIENQPLLTKEQRDRQILQKLAQYSQTVLRIYFPEKLVLQAVFMVTETVQTVCDFLKDYLENKNLDFYLYTTPPKEHLNKSKNLLECMLVPAAVIYFGCDTQLPGYLHSYLKDQKSDPRAAALAASKSRVCFSDSVQSDLAPLTENILIKPDSSILNDIPSASELSRPSTAGLPKSEKVPKWMKLSKK